MGRLRNGTAELLIATDVAARGLDVDLLTHVVNYDVPSAPDAYVHRIGRVGRAGREGVAITLAEPRELRLLGNIERAHRAADPDREGAVGRRAAGPPAGGHDRRRCATRWRADDLDRFAAVVDELAGEPTSATSPGRRSSSPTRPGRRRPTRSRSPSSCRATSGRDGRASAASRQRRETSGQPGGRFQGPGPKTRLFISLGRKDRIRPGDLVGAIANESDLTGRDIGPINITDNFSTVDVPAAAADAVIAAIKQTTIRGKRPTIRRDRHQRPTPLTDVQTVADARSVRALARRAAVARRAAAPCWSSSRMLAVMWAVEIIDLLPGHADFDRWGIRPRTVAGWSASRWRRSCTPGFAAPVRQHDPVPRARRVHRPRRPHAASSRSPSSSP